jgi:RND family efflux transporter MFP subunit
MLLWLQKPSVIIAVVVLGFGGVAVTKYVQKERTPEYQFVTASRRDLAQIVSVTGTVKPSSRVDLAFERVGKLRKMYGNVGEAVKAGVVLASLESSDLSAQISQADAGIQSAKASVSQSEAAVAVEKARLDELLSGARSEELDIYETRLKSAEKSLSEAERSIVNTKAKAESDRESIYQEIVNALQKSAISGKFSLIFFTDLQYAHFLGSDQEDFLVRESKAAAINDFFSEEQAGYWNTELVSKLSGGVYGEVQILTLDQGHEKILETQGKTTLGLQSIKNALNIVPLGSDITNTERSSLETYKTAIDGHISVLSQLQQSLQSQESVNRTFIDSAQAKVVEAQNGVDNAKREREFRRLSAPAEQITAQQARIQQAEAQVQTQHARVSEAVAILRNYQAQIGKTVLRAPISGVITRQDGKAGEIVAPNVPIVSLMGEDDLEVEAFVPEVDIRQVKIGALVRMDFDAYPQGESWNGGVFALDPAETVRDGVTTYRVRVRFVLKDDRIRSGMTANLDIFGESVKNVIALPARSILEKDRGMFVRVIQEGNLQEKLVKTSFHSSDGYVEIKEGVEDGERIVSFVEEK